MVENFISMHGDIDHFVEDVIGSNVSVSQPVNICTSFEVTVVVVVSTHTAHLPPLVCSSSIDDCAAIV
jgi:hypothetical protein